MFSLDNVSSCQSFHVGFHRNHLIAMSPNPSPAPPCTHVIFLGLSSVLPSKLGVRGRGLSVPKEGMWSQHCPQAWSPRVVLGQQARFWSNCRTVLVEGHNKGAPTGPTGLAPNGLRPRLMMPALAIRANSGDLVKGCTPNKPASPRTWFLCLRHLRQLIQQRSLSHRSHRLMTLNLGWFLATFVCGYGNFGGALAVPTILFDSDSTQCNPPTNPP